MRIAVDASTLELPCPTGVERFAREVLLALPSQLEPGDELIAITRRSIDLPEHGRRVRALATGGKEPLAIWREGRLPKALRSQGAHVLWSPVAAIPLRAPLPRVATIHELPWRVRPAIEGALRERVHRTRLRLAAGCAARLVVPSRATAAHLAEEVPEAASRVRVVPLGTTLRLGTGADDAARAALRARARAPERYLLHVGGTRPRKDVSLLLGAFARYRLQGGVCDLVLAGPGPAPQRPPAGVLHLGYVSDELLEALYDGAAALAVSSLSEGFGLPILEAMAHGVPVVTTDAGGLPATAGDAALLVAAGDPEAFADTLLLAERDPELRQQLVERGRARALESSWDRTARALREVLDEAVSSR